MLIDDSRQTEWDSLWCLLEDHKTNLGANIWHYAVWPRANQRHIYIYMCDRRGTRGTVHAVLYRFMIHPHVSRHHATFSENCVGFFFCWCVPNQCVVFGSTGDVTVVLMWITIPRKKSKPPTPSRSWHWMSCFPGTKFNPQTLKKKSYLFSHFFFFFSSSLGFCLENTKEVKVNSKFFSQGDKHWFPLTEGRGKKSSRDWQAVCTPALLVLPLTAD